MVYRPFILIIINLSSFSFLLHSSRSETHRQKEEVGEKEGDLKISGEGMTKAQKKKLKRVLNKSEEGTVDLISTVMCIL